MPADPTTEANGFSILVASVSPFVYGACISISTLLYESIQRLGPAQAAEVYKRLNLFFFGGAFIANIAAAQARLECTKLISVANFLFLCGFALYCRECPRAICLGRLLCGCGAGIAANIVPSYTRLIAAPAYQGFVASCYGVCIVAGVIAGFACSYLQLGLRNSVYCALGLLAAQLGLLFACRRYTLPKKAASDSGSFLSFLLNPRARRSLVIIALLHTAQHLCGINHILLNAGTVFPGAEPTLLLIKLCAVALCASFFSSVLSQRVGRALLVTAGCAGMGASCAAFYFTFHPKIFAVAFILGYNTAISGIPFVLIGEIFPLEDMARGALFATSCNWAGAFASVYALSNSAQKRNPSFLFYLGYHAVLIATMLLLYKETRGKRPGYQ
ncbi:hypothetical protein PAPHI01_1640 [Pancytospora philotis]|nr:hypothetical protein PAPHI01_1640 [Pancytospora philotis]